MAYMAVDAARVAYESCRRVEKNRKIPAAAGACEFLYGVYQDAIAAHNDCIRRPPGGVGGPGPCFFC